MTASPSTSRANAAAVQLRDQARRIGQLVAGVSEEQARWKPARDSWSILEVMNHLYDEEREDFRTRLEIILYHPDRRMPEIDPGGWVVSRKYNTRELGASVANFQRERQTSLVWLTTLRQPPDWNMTYMMPWGEIRAGDMLAAWLAHDLLHMRQLVELHWAWHERESAPYMVAYAGEW